MINNYNEFICELENKFGLMDIIDAEKEYDPKYHHKEYNIFIPEKEYRKPILKDNNKQYIYDDYQYRTYSSERNKELLDKIPDNKYHRFYIEEDFGGLRIFCRSQYIYNNGMGMRIIEEFYKSYDEVFDFITKVMDFYDNKD